MSTMSSARCAGLAGDVVDRTRHVEQVLAGELLLRIVRRVAARLDAEPRLDDRRVVAEQRVDFVGAPQVEGAFLLVRRAARPLPAGRCRRLRPNRSRRRRRSSRASRRAACLRRLRRRTDRPTPATLRRRRAPAAPGRRASSRNAARARRRRPSSDESRRRCGRACRRAPSRAACAAPCPRASASPARACSRSRNSSSDGRGNFGASPKPPYAPIERLAELLHRLLERVGAGDGPPTAPACSIASQLRGQRLGRLDDLVALRSPDAGDLLQDVDEPRPSPLRRRRKVGAAVERLQIRRQPDAHRPSAGSGRRLHERHVDAIDIGPLLAIDLDRHEVLVEHGGDRVALERLVLHHVAPVAGRVADREKDRFVFGCAPSRTPRRPTETSRPGSARAAADRDCARARGGSFDHYDIGV